MPNNLQPSSRQIVLALALMAALLILSVGAPLRGRADAPVHFFYFYDPNCAACQQVHSEVLEPLLALYGDRVVADERDMSDSATFEFLLGLEAQYAVKEPGIPEIFIGQDALIGPQEIQSRLKERGSLPGAGRRGAPRHPRVPRPQQEPYTRM